MGPKDIMKAMCWVVIEGEVITITNLNNLLYYIVILFVGTKSTFVEIVYNLKLRDSSHVCRGLYSTEGVSHEWVLAMGVVRDTSTWLEC